MKAVVGFLEPLSDCLDDKIQHILSDMMNQEMDKYLRKSFLKYLFLNLNLIYKTPLSFQRFSAETVLSMYNRKEWEVEQHVSLEWIIKYLTIYSILDAGDEAAAPAQTPHVSHSSDSSLSPHPAKHRDEDSTCSRSVRFSVNLNIM